MSLASIIQLRRHLLALSQLRKLALYLLKVAIERLDQDWIVDAVLEGLLCLIHYEH